jgi:hypothetical protein
MTEGTKGKARRLAAAAMSIGLASAGIVLPAPAQASPGCWETVQMQCAYQWQAWGYYSDQQCAAEEPCRYCPPDGHDCFEIDWIDPRDVTGH